MKDTRSKELYERAKVHIPGGVNSPVRAFRAVNRTPRFMESAKGDRIIDADGNEYIDYVCSWGPGILGHAHPQVIKKVMDSCENGLTFGAPTEKEVILAELISELIPSMEVSRLVSSGTEAVMSAIRAARGFTGRDKIVKFRGCYHGHSDGLLVKAGSGVMTAGVPDSSGVPASVTKDTLTAEYNNVDSVRTLFEQCGEEIAAIIVEPVGANMGVVPPKEGFLQSLREICNAYGSVLIFDEVITGFRLSLSGAQGYYGVTPDLTTFGKIIGAGMPVGAYGGRRDIMEQVAPVGNVYQAGTLSGNPVAMAAGITQLTLLKDHPEYYTELNEKSDLFFGQIKELLRQKELPWQVNHVGSIGSIFFTQSPVTDYASAKTSDVSAYAAYCNKMLAHGIYIAPAQFEAMFISLAHTKEDIDITLKTMAKCL